MFCQSSSGDFRPMSFGQGGCNPNEAMDEFYGGINAHWPVMERSPYGTVTHPYNASAYQNPAILTPISLPDSSYAQAHTRTSPVLSNHSQQQEYQYPVSDSAIPHHGLGITTPFPSELTRDASFGLGIAPTSYTGLREETISPQPSLPRRRQRRDSRQPAPHNPPVQILPNPHGVQLLEQQRRQSYGDPNTQRPRAPGRGRKDPQAEEEDAFVEGLREQNLSWRTIRDMFRERYNKDATEARLQMRQVRRRKERLARWDEHDVRVLLRARHYWEQEKYRLIAQKMAELGATTTFTAEQCEAQLDNIDAQEREREEQDNAQQSHTTEPRRKRRRTETKEPGEKASQKKTPREKKKTKTGT
ncbi:hypothetical protein ASPVEDRAFT_739308 [Aspergillus versicolor CBS 583.65]|uniref:Myb-like domain-containing protein n=1 Tax=Aspergillus versicolor CBS 583.65 TaxID=1036611 RepID=A0A1L9PQ19_ASPVE|nr:uncharacterized protein ASPVEDRAFT_739308 [Aspergillus versicolor CBS 583.65]OJJ03562.1 hypothetical protein ASPVEDRAFT_739308 [Aspergillus versicolor CBS 583.65]